MENKKRLIDLDKAFEAINQEVWWTESEKAYIRSFLVKQPKVDAVEVVHGRWRYDSYNMRYYCTECDEEPCKFTKTFLDGSTLTEECLTDYCPNCGAKMDGDGNGT